MSMSKSRTIGIAVICAAVGAAGGIAGTTAATSTHKHRSHGSRQTGAARPGRPPFGDHRGFGAPPVHVEAVVLDKAGKSWITVTEDSGTVKSVSGSDVTITEGTADVPYKDVTVTIPDGATVMRNGAKAAVGDLKAGDHVHVASSSDGTFVFAADDSWQPPRGPWGHDGDGDHRGPPPGGPGGGDWSPAPPPGSDQ
jgi:hypothetical protein